MNIISWTRLCYVLLAGPELEEFLLDLAVKSAAASRCDKSVGEAYLELRREIWERPLILCTCSDSVLATLRCPHCGARLVRDGIHFRHAEEAEFVIRGQLGLDCGIGEDGRAIFAIPRLKCTAKRACVRNFSVSVNDNPTGRASLPEYHQWCPMGCLPWGGLGAAARGNSEDGRRSAAVPAA